MMTGLCLVNSQLIFLSIKHKKKWTKTYLGKFFLAQVLVHMHKEFHIWLTYEEKVLGNIQLKLTYHIYQHSQTDNSCQPD